MRQRTVAAFAAFVVLAGCATGPPDASPRRSAVVVPELSPAPSRSASPPATFPESVALITVFKSWDADGNASTTNDRRSFAVVDFPPGAYPLEFELAVQAAGGLEPEVSAMEPADEAQAVFQIESEAESVTVTLTENRTDNSTLVGGHCYDTETQQIVAGIQGDAVTFEIPIGRSLGCIFINTPVPEFGASN